MCDVEENLSYTALFKLGGTNLWEMEKKKQKGNCSLCTELIFFSIL
jgi:hypothetical protein